MSDEPPADAVIVELIRNGVIAVTEEMKINLMRTAYNVIIYEALDFTVGLFTPAGDTVSIGLGLPMFIRGMSETVKTKIRHYGIDNIRDGDIYLTNDAYITGSHLNHITLTMPVFHEGDLVAFTCCMAHWLDIGGSIGTITTDIYSEGLQLPILKYQSQGVVNQDLIDIILMNVRLRDQALGDLRAQVTAVVTGARGFLDLVNRYGKDSVRHAIDAIMSHSDAAARAGTRSIPDGVYEAESFMDDDGITIGTRVPIRVRVEVSGDEMTIDMSGVGDQVRGFYNSGLTTGIACAQVAFKCLTTPTQYPVNDGSFRALKVIMPEGRVISATRPAPMRWWMTYPMTVIDTVFKALAPAIPDRVIAGHYADLVVGMCYGIHPEDGQFYIGGVGPPGGGWGAKQSEDGRATTICINDGDTHNSPIEQAEAKYPLLVEKYALRPDSGGAGTHRGGLGADLVFRALAPMTVSTTIERVHCRPWGLHGGHDGAGNAVAIRAGDEDWNFDLPNAKLAACRLRAGDAFLLRSGGGGGFGDPLGRDLESLAHDVREGYVSGDAAKRDYGAVLTAAGEVSLNLTREHREPRPSDAPASLDGIIKEQAN